MPVLLPAPDPKDLYPVPGVELGWAEAEIRKPDRKDLLLIRCAEGAQVGGIFTRNRFPAAPVLVAKEHLDAAKGGASIRMLVINTGCANAGTGRRGIEDARATCAAVAAMAGCRAAQVLPFSTGVIMEPLPMERLRAGLPSAYARLAPDEWFGAAQAIMTTDTVPKAYSRRVRITDSVADRSLTVTGIAKGSGMIHPNMATMLGFIATDAVVDPRLIARLARRIGELSFNRICVDGDTSTNDSLILIASGHSAAPAWTREDDPRFAPLLAALDEVAVLLAQAIVRDGEGASKFIAIDVQGAGTQAEARAVAEAIARSPLVKTAFFASDPNLGRILAAIGNSGIADLDCDRVHLYLNEVSVARDGGRDPQYREEDGQRVMRGEEIAVRVELGRGAASTTLWTCDLSHDYVSINADYRS